MDYIHKYRFTLKLGKTIEDYEVPYKFNKRSLKFT